LGKFDFKNFLRKYKSKSFVVPKDKESINKLVSEGEKRIEELKCIDQKLAAIQKSTKTSISFFAPIHNYCRVKYQWYYDWHLKPYATQMHFGLLAIVLSACLLSAYYPLLGNPKMAKAADYTCTWNGTNGNWSDVTKWTNCNAGLDYPGMVAGKSYDVSIPSGSVTLVAGVDITGGNTTFGNLTIARGSTLSSGNNALTVSTITINGTLTAGTGNTISVGGNWTNTGTFAANTSTINFNGTTTGHTINPGSSRFNNVTFSGSGGGWSPLTNKIYIDGNLTMTAGTFDNSNGSADVEVGHGAGAGNTYGTNGVINFTTNTFTQFDNCQVYFGTTSGTTDWSFYNLTLGGWSCTVHSNPGTGDISIKNVLTLAGGSYLHPGNRIWHIQGSGTGASAPFIDMYDGRITGSSNSTFSYEGTAPTDVCLINYTNLALNPSSAATFNLTNNHSSPYQLAGSLTIGPNATLDPKTYNLTVNGAFSNWGNFGVSGAKPSGVHTFSSTFANAGTFYTTSNAVTGTAVTGLMSLMGGSTFNATSNGIVTLSGGLSISNGATWTKGSGTLTFSSTQNVGDTNATTNDLGKVSIGGTATVTMNNNLKVTSLNIPISATFNLGASNYTLTLTGSGTPFIKGGTFVTTGSTVRYGGTSATSITTTQYNNLQLSGATTYSLVGNLTATNALTGDLIIDTGATLDVRTVTDYSVAAVNVTIRGTLDASSSASVLSASGTWDQTGGTFSQGNSKVKLTGNGTSIALKTDNYDTFYDFEFPPTNATVTLYNPITISSTVTYGDNTTYINTTGYKQVQITGNGNPLINNGANFGSGAAIDFLCTSSRNSTEKPSDAATARAR
jgi:hypothetical protein